jgi:hypothetical protein
MSVKRLFPLLYNVILMSWWLNAQETSTYSQYSPGELRGAGFTAQTSMGRITSAFADPTHINFYNPASYAQLKLTTFEGGAVFSAKTFETQNSKVKERAGFIDFAALAFPIVKRYKVSEELKEKELNVSVISIGLIPFSTVKYNFESDDTTADGAVFKRVFTGNGSAYQLFGGMGMKFPMKNDTARHVFAIGFNAIYYFGRNRHTELIDFVNNPTTYFGIRKNTALRHSDAGCNAGIQYTLRLAEKWSLTIGADAQLPFAINTKQEIIFDRFILKNNRLFVQDTVHAPEESTTRIHFPATYGAGLMIKKSGTWIFAIDGHYTRWKQFTDILHPTVVFKNSVRLNAGTEIIPALKGKAGFLKRIHYRLGGWYETAYLTLNEADISQYGITFGLGLPVRGTLSLVNIGMEIGQKGTVINNLTKETFIRTYLGFTLNDKWFIKRKYD